MTNLPHRVLLQNFDLTSVSLVLLHPTNDLGGQTGTGTVSFFVGTFVGLVFTIGGRHLLSTTEG